MANLNITGNLTVTGGGTLGGYEIVTDIGKSFQSIGYQRFRNGLMITWGTFSKTNSTHTFTHPFPNACFQVFTCGSGAQWEAINAGNFSKTSFTPISRYGDIPGQYIAIGY